MLASSKISEFQKPNNLKCLIARQVVKHKLVLNILKGAVKNFSHFDNNVF